VRTAPSIHSAKFTPPATGRIVARPRLDALLEAACHCPLAWLAAPPGSGKTALLASALTRDARPLVWIRLDADDADCDAFVRMLTQATASAVGRRMPGRLTAEPPATLRLALRGALGSLPPGGVLVLDELDESVLATMDALLPLMVEEAPEGTTIFVTTHLAPLSGLARHCANGRVAIIPADALRLDAAETASLLRSVAPDSGLDPARLQRLTAGWMAGTRLLAMSPGRRHPDQLVPAVGDYFARHVFERLDLDTRQLLLHVAALPDFDAADAAALSQIARAGSLLADLVRRNMFVERLGDARFAIHPLFRTFLGRQRDATLPAARRRALLDHSGRLAERSGDTALAADLYAASSSWNALRRVLRSAVPPLLEAQRADRVTGWLAALPAGEADSDAWEVLWRGILARGTDRSSAMTHFEAAWASFSALDDKPGLAATLDAALTAFVDADADLRDAAPWFERLEALAQQGEAVLPTRARAHLLACGAALLEWRLDHPLLQRWAGWFGSLARKLDDPGLASRLVAVGAAYHFWRGDVVRSAALLESHEPSRAGGDDGTGALLVRSLLEGDDPPSPSTGVDHDCHRRRADLASLLDFIRPCDLRPARGAARVSTDDDASPRDRVRNCVRLGRLTEAVDLQELRVEELRARARPLGLALALLDAGALAALARQPERGRRHLDEACALAEVLDSDLLRWNAGLWRAACADALGDPAVGSMVAAAVRVGARHGYLSCQPWWDAATMTRLMRQALEHADEQQFVSRLIRERGLVPDSPEPEAWPWPVRVYTLGRFKVVIDDNPVVNHGKAQRRPMDLLKAVISYGGRDIGIGALIEALWPDAEGDAGRKAFDVALLRLRRLLGRDDALLVSEGKISLNDRICWVDVWSLGRLLGTSTAHLAPEVAARHARRVLERYRGPFLNLEETQPWMLPIRDRVASRTLRLVLETGHALETCGAWPEATGLYQGMIDVLPAQEELYRRLMRCHEHLGNRAEARAVFERCRRHLASLLGRRPSSEMLDSYLALKSA